MWGRSLLAQLPISWQQELRRVKCRLDIGRAKFRSAEPEYELLGNFIKEGDWVLDIGANIGLYTVKMAKLVGPSGRVFAIEPMGATAEILFFVLRTAHCSNVTVFNMALSDQSGIVHFSLPNGSDGLPNYFLARMDNSGSNAVYCSTIDELNLPRPLSLVKIDAEGSEEAVIRGMAGQIKRDHPVLIVEGPSPATEAFLSQFGYKALPALPHSPNRVFIADAHA